MLTQRDVAAALGCSTFSVERWRRGGVGPPWVRIGSGERGALRYPIDLFREWLRSRLVMGSAGPPQPAATASRVDHAKVRSTRRAAPSASSREP